MVKIKAVILVPLKHWPTHENNKQSAPTGH